MHLLLCGISIINQTTILFDNYDKDDIVVDVVPKTCDDNDEDDENSDDHLLG